MRIGWGLNGRVATRGDLEIPRVQLAAAILSTAGGASGLCSSEKVPVLGGAGTCLRPEPQWPPKDISHTLRPVGPGPWLSSKTHRGSSHSQPPLAPEIPSPPSAPR